MSSGQSPVNKSSEDQPGNLRASHQAFRQVHDHSAIAILSMNADGNLSYANIVALNYIGLPAGKVIGHSFSSLFKDVTADGAQEAKLLQMAEITDCEFMVNTMPNKELWALISSKLYADATDDAQLYLFIRDISVLKKREKLSSYLNKAAEDLVKARDTESALDQIAKFIVPTFANWFTIDLLKDDHLELLLLKHDDPAKIAWAHEYRKSYPPDPNGNNGSAVALKTGKTAFVPVVTDEMIAATVADPVQLKLVRQIGLQSVIIAPIYNKDVIAGVVNFISSNADRHFDEADLEFALNFSNLIGLALENTRLNEAAANEISRRKDSEDQLRFLMDAIPHKIWTSGPDGQATYYNQGWYNYAGIEGLEQLRSKVWDMLHPADRAIAAVEWPRAIKNGTEMELEHRLQRHDGMYRWHLSRFIAHKNNEDEIVLWVGTSTDIHEQKEALLETEAVNDSLSSANEELTAVNEEVSSANEELAAVNEELATTNEELTETQGSLGETIEKLATSESRFRFLLNAIPQQVWTATPDGALNYVNEVVCNDFGYNTDEIVGHGWQMFIHPDDLPGCLSKWVDSLTTGKEYVVEFRLLFRDKSYRWHLGRAVPLMEDGAIKLWIGTNTNIELQKTNEQKKDEFLSIASHELKTPLTNIKAFNQLLQRIKDPEKLAPFVSKSSEHINRLERLISDLLDVTKINAGKMSYSMERFDFGKMIRGTVESTRLIEQDYEILLDEQADIEYTGDHFRLEQVVNNFISNAVKYSQPGTKVIVRTGVSEQKITVAVQDFGIGIGPDHIGHLFDRYYRVDNTAMRFEGLGLGLFISSEILKRHQGDFWIESELGKGSTFYFSLPLTGE